MDCSNYRISSQIMAFFLTNLTKSKYNHYIDCIIFQYKF